MNKKIAIGHHDFESLIQNELYYVDKTPFIQKLIENKSVFFLFPRPRRFGKTLNMMMLRRFFEISEKSKAHLFDRLKIKDWQDFEKYQGKFPLIWISLQSDYRISSNRESGYGRYDIVLHPLKKELPGFIFEFKKFDDEDVENIHQTLDSAFQQILEKEYANILVQEGCENIHHIAIAFRGKEVKMRYE